MSGGQPALSLRSSGCVVTEVALCSRCLGVPQVCGGAAGEPEAGGLFQAPLLLNRRGASPPAAAGRSFSSFPR